MDLRDLQSFPIACKWAPIIKIVSNDLFDDIAENFVAFMGFFHVITEISNLNGKRGNRNSALISDEMVREPRDGTNLHNF